MNIDHKLYNYYLHMGYNYNTRLVQSSHLRVLFLLNVYARLPSVSSRLLSQSLHQTFSAHFQRTSAEMGQLSINVHWQVIQFKPLLTGAGALPNALNSGLAAVAPPNKGFDLEERLLACVEMFA